MKNTGANIESVGKKFLSATVAIGAFGTMAVKVTADFDTSMSKVAAVSGATEDELGKLREKTREIGEKTKFSASETIWLWLVEKLVICSMVLRG